MAFTPKSDTEILSIIEMVKKGHKQAFSQLVKMHYGMVIYYLLGMGLSKSDAEDVSQEAFINAFTKIDQFRSSGSFVGWLLRIARNQYIDRLRREKKITVTQESSFAEIPDERTPELQVVSETNINDVIRNLKPREKVILELRVFQMLPFAEISDIMNISEGNVRLIFHRLIGRLRKQQENKSD